MPRASKPQSPTVGMAMSVFLAQLREAEHIADRLLGELGVEDFGRDLHALEEIVDRLAPFTRARGGGELRVDLDRYAGEGGGGAPAFFREHALRLLNLATIVKQAREGFYARDGAGGIEAAESGDDADGRASQRDLRFARTARIGYTADEVRKVQKVMKYLYSRRAYEKLKQGGVYRRAVEDGRVWGGKSIQTLSRDNLGHLRRILRPLDDDERRLYERLLALPFRLKHATTETGRQGIVNIGMLWSLDSLFDWYVVGGSGFTTPGDKKQKMDTDFVFFRVEVGDQVVDTRYGDVQFVFTMEQVLADGWVTLHDMLAPIGSETLRLLKLRDGDTLVRRSSYIDDDGPWWKERWKHEILDEAGKTRRERLVHILDEVFYGPDILQGIVLSILRDLRELPLLQREAFDNMADRAYLAWLFRVLYRVEAKYPGSFAFGGQDLVTEHRKPAVDPRVLAAATGTAPNS